MNYEELKKTLYEAVDLAIESLSDAMPEQGVVFLTVTGTQADAEVSEVVTAEATIAGLADDTWVIDEYDCIVSKERVDGAEE